MAYYDKIANQWHKNTGYKGGSFKELILNNKVIAKVDEIEAKTILEIGIGNGYFMPLLLKRKSGQIPEKIFLTDISKKNLEIAQKHFKIQQAIYKKLDLYKSFPIENKSVDWIISNMVFNEVNEKGLRNGLQEIKKVLKPDGKFVLSVLHPDFIQKQIERGVIKNNLMISANGLKIPTIKREIDNYTKLLSELNFNFKLEEVYGNSKLYNQKPKLKELENTPIALILFGNLMESI